jgi:hypothetical protein
MWSWQSAFVLSVDLLLSSFTKIQAFFWILPCNSVFNVFDHFTSLLMQLHTVNVSIFCIITNDFLLFLLSHFLPLSYLWFYSHLSNLELAFEFVCTFIIREGAFYSNKVKNFLALTVMADVSPNQLIISYYAPYLWLTLKQEFPLAFNNLFHLFLFASRGREPVSTYFLPYEQLRSFFGSPVTCLQHWLSITSFNRAWAFFTVFFTATPPKLNLRMSPLNSRERYVNNSVFIMRILVDFIGTKLQIRQ